MSESSRDQRVQAILHRYLQAVDAGQTPDREEIVRQYPEFASELREFFADQEKMDRLASSLHRGHALAGEITLGADEVAGADTTTQRVKYFGDYELQEEIARGGMGVVFKAKQVSLNRPVALKMILQGELASEADVLRFRTEAEAAANLDHPNIVPIYEIGEHEGQQYFSMKLIGPGNRRTNLDETVRLMILVASAVHHAHQRGILHRDLKPGNILFDENGDPHVADFGLAKRVGGEGEGESGMTRSGAIVGTPSYMAPEQARAEKVLTTAVDVYSLGAILYEWLTGQPPFRGDDVLATLQMVANDEPRRPCSLNPSIDRDLETICLKCLQKDANRRYGSAEMVAEDLQRWQAGEPILARPAGTAEKATKWIRRRPVVAGLSAAVFLASVVGIAAFAWSYGETVTALEETEKARKQADDDRKDAIAAKKQADDEKKLAEIATEFAKTETARAEDQRKKAEANEKNANWRLYASEIASAQRAWESNNADVAFRFLESCRMDFRGWEHDYLYTLFNKNQQTVRGNLIWTDGKTFITEDPGKTRTVWDVDSGKEIRSFKSSNFRMPLTGWAVSSDGKKIATFDDKDKTIKLWNVETGKEILTFKEQSGLVGNGAFSPDGKMIVNGFRYTKKLILWDAVNGSEIRSFLDGDPDNIDAIVFSPDSKKFACGYSSGRIMLFDVAGGQKPMILDGHTASVECLAFTPDGKKIVSGSWDKTLKVWDTKSGKDLLTLKGNSGIVWSVAVSPDGKKIASGSEDMYLKLWDTDNGQEILSLRGHADEIRRLAFSPDGQKIISGSRDNATKVWFPLARQESPAFRPNLKDGACLAFSPDHKKFLVFDGSAPQIWDAETGKKALTLKGVVESVGLPVRFAFNGNGNKVFCRMLDGSVVICDAQTGKRLKILKGHSRMAPCLAVSRDGAKVAGCSIKLIAGPDRKQIVGTSSQIILWDATSGDESMTFDALNGPVFEMEMSPDGKKIVTSFTLQSTLKVWNAETGKEIATLRGHTNKVRAIAFSPDGKKIVTGSYDNTLILWNAASGKEIQVLKGHGKGVHCVAFSPDGKRIVSYGLDKTVKVWDAESGQETLSLQQNDPVISIAFSSDGKQIMSGSSDGTVKIWDASRTQR
jgi:eukaryotic-like serine/threonine-protein kinase